ncbi:MAG: Fic family protein [Holophagaceae bacterium]|nr:Fic family protein [Holophagaceae bacterium]
MPDGLKVLPAGSFRGEQSMVVASRPRATDLSSPDIIHFEAPGRERLDAGMEAFLAWFNAPPPGLNGLLRAGLAHLWFITLHPMADGNGRLARTITDLALSQDERLPRRFYSLSVQILRAKDSYYDALEQAQRGSLDVTAWLAWFLAQVEAATLAGLREVGRVLARSAFWAEARRFRLEERQERALQSILSPMNPEADVSNRKYRALTGVSRATAQRDLAVLAGMGLLIPFGEARAASYRVALERWLPEGFRVGADG